MSENKKCPINDVCRIYEQSPCEEDNYENCSIYQNVKEFIEAKKK